MSLVQQLISVAVVLAVGGSPFGQTNVPGDYPTVQAALDAAPSGAVIVVRGGTWEPIIIRRPVTLIGDPVPNIGGLSPNGMPIVLDGGGSGRVTLSSIEVGGVYPDSILSAAPPPAISGGGFEELHIYDSQVTAPQRSMFDFSGLGYGNSAIDVDVPYLVMERSSAVGGGAGIDDDCTGNPAQWAPPPAIVAGTVVLLHSSAQGGSNGSFQYAAWPTDADCDPGNCPSLPGGAGISCGLLYYTGAEPAAFGGGGARWSPCVGSFCCQSMPGQGVIAGQTVQLRDGLSAGPMRLGEDVLLYANAPGPLARLLGAFGIAKPYVVPGLGLSFLPPAGTVSLGPVVSPGVVTVPLPADLALAGTKVTFQLVDPTNGFSEPAVGVLLPFKTKTVESPAPGGSVITRPL